jgi:hypothetical protein
MLPEVTKRAGNYGKALHSLVLGTGWAKIRQSLTRLFSIKRTLAALALWTCTLAQYMLYPV